MARGDGGGGGGGGGGARARTRIHARYRVHRVDSGGGKCLSKLLSAVARLYVRVYAAAPIMHRLIEDCVLLKRNVAAEIQYSIARTRVPSSGCARTRLVKLQRRARFLATATT